MLVTLLIAVVGMVVGFPCQKPPVSEMPYCNTSLSFEDRAGLLVAKMETAEIIPQLLTNAPAIKNLGVEEYNYWSEVLF